MLNHIRAAENNNLVPIIRVPHVSSELISKALDIGAYGVQVPQVSTPKQVEDIISFSKFYPKGERGLCRFVREANFSKKAVLIILRILIELLLLYKLKVKLHSKT